MPRFTSQPLATSVYLGGSQVMTCEVNSDLVPFTRWEKDRQPLELNSRLLQLPSGALVVSNASDADGGLYRCMVDNVGSSSKSSDEAQLHVLPGEPLLRLLLSGSPARRGSGSNPVPLQKEKLNSSATRTAGRFLLTKLLSGRMLAAKRR